MSEEVVIGTKGIRTSDVISIARLGSPIVISQEALSAMSASRKIVDDLASSEIPAYGISTGFGALAKKHINPELRAQLQKSLIRSHAAGSGAPVEDEVVRPCAVDIREFDQ